MVALKSIPNEPALPVGPVRGMGLSFRERYCDALGLNNADFDREIFYLCLHPRAQLLGWLRGRAGDRLFAADLELIASVGAALSLKEVGAAIDDYHGDPVNDRWLRRVAKIRISTLHLRRISSRYLPFHRPRWVTAMAETR